MRFPKDDSNFRKIAFDDLENLRVVCELVEGRDCVVQAGGNVGIFPNALADYGFNKVLTFEPDAENFDCLLENCTAPAIVPQLAALSNEVGTCRVVGPRADCGSLQVCPGDDVPALTIDSLGLDGCDLIYLDVEGSEHRALVGGLETIAKFKPVIVCENKGLCDGFRGGRKGNQAFREFVESLGYTFHLRIRGDDVFLPCA